MAKIIFNKGDKFEFPFGYGIVISPRRVLTITRLGRRWKVQEINVIPNNSRPLENYTFAPYVVQIAMDTVIAMIEK